MNKINNKSSQLVVYNNMNKINNKSKSRHEGRIDSLSTLPLRIDS